MRPEMLNTLQEHQTTFFHRLPNKQIPHRCYICTRDLQPHGFEVVTCGLFIMCVCDPCSKAIVAVTNQWREDRAQKQHKTLPRKEQGYRKWGSTNSDMSAEDHRMYDDDLESLDDSKGNRDVLG